ncbi:MAG: hypothetical protein IPL12_22130 [Bacteroidetes bacterium]|nr:hypothetical protein [Bacteroidota bacterium]
MGLGFFDDGSASTDENPEHEYADGGITPLHSPCKQIKDVNLVLPMIFSAEPGPDVAFDVDDVCQNVEAEFDNNTTITTGSISSYAGFW